MSYLEEEIIFDQESVLEELWGNPIVLIYDSVIKVMPRLNYSSCYIPFIYKNRPVVIEKNTTEIELTLK